VWVNPGEASGPSTEVVAAAAADASASSVHLYSAASLITAKQINRH